MLNSEEIFYEKHENYEKYQDPVRFVREVLGEEPYDKQEEILRAVASSRRVSVVGCNGSGKDWAAARVVLWWMHSRAPAKAIVTGPTARQVDEIVWNEMRYAYGKAADRLGGQMFRTSKYEIDDQSFALGFTSNSPYNIQGFHSPNLLVVMTCPPKTVPGYIRSKVSQERGRNARKKIRYPGDHQQTQGSRSTTRFRS